MDPPLRFGDLAPGDRVAGHARVVAAEAAVARTGDPFHRLTLADPAGARLSARRFAAPEPPPPPGAVVRICGVVEVYRGERCLKLKACAVDPSAPPQRFWPAMPPARRATLEEFDALVEQIADPAVRAWVVTAYAAWPRERLAAAPAAVARHGAAVGGLLAHTVRVARLALALAGLAGDAVDRDVLLAAALLHDLGKLEEFHPEPGLDPTDRGRLLGHVLLGALAAARAAEGIAGLAPARVEAVLHAVVAAHGRREWGAPVAPATLEAVLLHQADRTEATVEAALEATERLPPGEGWTEYLPAFAARLRAPSTARESGPIARVDAGG